MTQFAIRVSSLFAAPMLLIGVSAASAHVLLDGDHLMVNYGFFSYRVPLANIVSAEPMEWPWYYGLGLRIVPGPAVGCVASSEGVVRLKLAEPLRGKIAGALGIRYQAIAISLVDPQAFIAAIQAHGTQASD